MSLLISTDIDQDECLGGKGVKPISHNVILIVGTADSLVSKVNTLAHAPRHPIELLDSAQRK